MVWHAYYLYKTKHIHAFSGIPGNLNKINGTIQLLRFGEAVKNIH